MKNTEHPQNSIAQYPHITIYCQRPGPKRALRFGQWFVNVHPNYTPSEEEKADWGLLHYTPDSYEALKLMSQRGWDTWDVKALYEYNAQNSTPSYVFRNYDCNVAAPDQLWAVCGMMSDATHEFYGVLEYCIGEEDASQILKKMKKDHRFRNLKAMLWKDAH